MKPPTPPANIIIGILYSFGLIATIFLIKWVFKTTPKPKNTPKFNNTNYVKALASPSINSDIDSMPLLLKSYALKYTFVGGFFNAEKLYLLK